MTATRKTTKKKTTRRAPVKSGMPLILIHAVVVIVLGTVYAIKMVDTLPLKSWVFAVVLTLLPCLIFRRNLQTRERGNVFLRAATILLIVTVMASLSYVITMNGVVTEGQMLSPKIPAHAGSMVIYALLWVIENPTNKVYFTSRNKVVTYTTFAFTILMIVSMVCH